MTVEPAPHRVNFERQGASVRRLRLDALATPFVQGQLAAGARVVLVETECARCGRPLRFAVDDELAYSFETPQVEPLLFVPQVDFGKLRDPSIIDAF